MWQHMPMNNICSNVYVYLYYSKLEPAHLFFLLCLYFKILCPKESTRQMYKPHRLQCSHCCWVVSAVPPVPNIISSLDYSSCQGKLYSVRCLQSVICSFYYSYYYYFKLICPGVKEVFCLFGGLSVCVYCSMQVYILKAWIKTHIHLLHFLSIVTIIKQKIHFFFVNSEIKHIPQIFGQALCNFCLTTLIY